MLPSGGQGLRLFRFAGIDVFLHWSWFVVALYEVRGGVAQYSSLAWNVAEYLGLFVIVTLHEFGHSLACRQVGGVADHIVLWPLGGVAYVQPPQRPGATLWSLAAGPLVNLVLVPVLLVLGLLGHAVGLAEAVPDAALLIRSLAFINLGLLIFNLLPIYPLDGGQILRSLLWFVVGRARSLTAATVVGFVGVIGFIGIAIFASSPWMGVIAFFAGINCWRGFQQARILARLADLPRRAGYACPSCKAQPPEGALWMCDRCHKPFDTFEERAECPYCRAHFATTACPDCGVHSPLDRWETDGGAVGLEVRPQP
jgi:Zn-dependent protease